MTETPPPADRQWPLLTLRRVDQGVVAVLVLFSLLILGGHWWWEGRFRGQVIEIEHAEPTHVAFQVDINSADWPELTLLPEVGEQLAKRIVEWRAEHGSFGDLNQLRRVRGIGPKTFERVKPYLVPIPETGNVVGSPRGEIGKKSDQES